MLNVFERATGARSVIAGLVGLASLVGHAGAQSGTGDFRTWLPSAFGGVGVDPSAPGGFTILVDDDGDVLTPPVAYNLDAQAPALADATNYILSPTRESLYVLKADPGGTGPADVWLADLDGMGGVDVRHGAYSVQGQTGPASVLQGPFWYESDGGLRTAVVIFGNQSAGEIWAGLFDMTTPGLPGEARVDLRPGLGQGWFAPSGTHLVIKNGLSDTDTQFVDFTLIDACGSGGGLGMASDIRVNTGDIPPDPVFTVTRVGGGTIDVVGQIPGQPGAIFSGTLDECGGAVTPELGACCFNNGGSTFCIDGLTEAECGTGTFSANMTCSDACPQPTVSVAAGGPQTVQAGGLITYTYAVSNTGGVQANSVIVSAAAPAGTQIESVSVGGIVSGANVTWTIPSLDPGDSESFIMSVGAPCTGGQVVMDTYSARIGFTPFTGAPVSTDVVALDPADIMLTVDSVADTGAPVLQGDLVTHTVTMSNTGPFDAEGVSLGCIRMGNGNELAGIVDDAGGTVVTGACEPGSVSWTGTIAAGETRTLVFRTRVACVSPTNPGGQPGVWLNRGVQIRMEQPMPCGTVLASATAPIIEATPPMSASLAYSEIGPGTLRLNPVSGGFLSGVVGMGRMGEPAEVLLTIENQAGPDLTAASFDYTLGQTFEAVGSPFIGTPPAGVTFDAATETVSYTGPLATGETIEVRMSLVMSSHERPSDTVTLRAGAGCAVPGFPSRNAEIYAVPLPPAVPHVNAVSGFDHYRHDAPFGDGFDARLPDFYFELLAGIGAGPDGSLYVADLLRSYVLNPVTLFFDVFEEPAFPQEADPVGGGMVHLRERSLWRYLPDGTRTLLYEDTADTYELREAAVTRDGRVHVLVRELATGDRFFATLDPRGATLPLGPADLTGFIAPPTISYSYEGLFGPRSTEIFRGLASDGDTLLVLVSTSWQASMPGQGGIGVIALARINPADGTLTVEEPELSIVRGFNPPPVPMDADPITFGTISDIPFVSPAEGPVFERDSGNTYLTVDTVNRLPIVFLVNPPQTRYNGIALTGVTCGIADLNGDGLLDIADVNAFIAAFGAFEPRVDFDGNGLFDLSDINAFVAAFVAGCPS